MTKLPPPKTCPACHDHRIKVYYTLYSVADDTGQDCVWQCYGCGALLEPGVYRIARVGYAAVVMPHGLNGEGRRRRRPKATAGTPAEGAP